MSRSPAASPGRGRALFALLVLGLCWHAGASSAQNRPPAAPAAGKAGAQSDFTGYWTSVVSEDWRWRMVTPLKGDFANIPLNAAGQAIGEAWDPAKDKAAGEQCRAYAAPGLFRLPEHLHIWWRNDLDLVIQVDAGMQLRDLHFAAAAPVAPARPPSPQGYSQARWEGPQRAPYFGAGLGLNPRGDARSKTLEVVTTDLQAGYLRKNGIPFSARTRMTEYFDEYRDPDASEWILVTSIVEDPVYLTAPWVTTTDFKRLMDGALWHPLPCVAR